MAKKQNTMSAPAQARRITSTGLAKVSLPDMPVISTSTDFTPGKMAGMGGTGVGLGFASGMAGGGTGARGGLVPFFGMRRSGNGLAGSFYDLKQDKNGQPTNMALAAEDIESAPEKAANAAYEEELRKFCKAGWNQSRLRRFFKAPEPLYTTQLFIPAISAVEAPNSFNVGDKVKPRRWIIHYEGKITPPESGKYRFVGFGDDVLAVKFNGRVVLDSGFTRPSDPPPPKQVYAFEGMSTDPKINWGRGCAAGDTFEASAGSSYSIEIIIGEQPGGIFKAWLLLDKDGAQYDKDVKGNPRFPIFKLAPSAPPVPGSEAPAFGKDTSWSVWKAVVPKTTSIFGQSS